MTHYNSSSPIKWHFRVLLYNHYYRLNPWNRSYLWSETPPLKLVQRPRQQLYIYIQPMRYSHKYNMHPWSVLPCSSTFQYDKLLFQLMKIHINPRSTFCQMYVTNFNKYIWFDCLNMNSVTIYVKFKYKPLLAKRRLLYKRWNIMF